MIIQITEMRWTVFNTECGHKFKRILLNNSESNLGICSYASIAVLLTILLI